MYILDHLSESLSEGDYDEDLECHHSVNLHALLGMEVLDQVFHVLGDFISITIFLLPICFELLEDCILEARKIRVGLHLCFRED